MISSRSRHLLPACLAAMAIAAALQVSTQSQGRTPLGRQIATHNGYPVAANEVLVQFVDMPAAVVAQLPNIQLQIDADVNVGVGRHGLRRFRSRTFDVETLLAFFQGQPGVLYAEPNYIVGKVVIPNDPDFPNLWGLHNTGQPILGVPGTPDADIDAPEAWDISTGSTSVVVGVIDTGVDYTHPDLAANAWSAPSEFIVNIGGIMTNCPAGSHGFNAITHVCDPFDDEGHGTHVSGTIGARGNNGVGVTGVNWITRIIGGKFLDASGFGSTANAIDSIDFMIQAKAQFGAGANIRVLNNSWGGGGFSASLQTAITNANANNMLFVAAAGNGGPDGIGDNNDISRSIQQAIRWRTSLQWRRPPVRISNRGSRTSARRASISPHPARPSFRPSPAVRTGSRAAHRWPRRTSPAPQHSSCPNARSRRPS